MNLTIGQEEEYKMTMFKCRWIRRTPSLQTNAPLFTEKTHIFEFQRIRNFHWNLTRASWERQLQIRKTRIDSLTNQTCARRKTERVTSKCVPVSDHHKTFSSIQLQNFSSLSPTTIDSKVLNEIVIPRSNRLTSCTKSMQKIFMQIRWSWLISLVA